MKNQKILTLLVVGCLALGSSATLFAEKGPTNASAAIVVKNDVKTVISKYIEAIGGEDRVKSIKNASMTAEASIQGQAFQIQTISDSENSRLMQSTSVGGNVIQKTLLVDGKGQMIVMGQAQDLPESTVSLLKAQTYVIPEQYYDEMGFEIAYIGIEDLQGTSVHKLELTSPSGIVTQDFYSVASGLKLKSSSGENGDVSYSDYQEVDGIMFPMVLTIKNPMLPVALEAKIVSLKFNQTLTDEDFK